MKACFLVVLLAFGAAFAAEEAASDAAPKEVKARQLAAAAPAAATAAFNPARAYPYNAYPGAYYQGAPAQAYYQGAYSAAPASYYQGAYSGAYAGAPASYYQGAYPGNSAYYSGAYSSGAYNPAYPGAPASYYSANPYYSGAQFAPKNAYKPAYSQPAFAAPAYKGAAPAPAFVAPAYKGAAVAPAFAAPAYKGAAPAAAYAAPAYKGAYADPAYKGAYAAQPYSVIVKQVLDNNYDGSFTNSYETDQGQVVDSRGFVKNAGTPDETQVIQGSYSYISPEGQPITTYYIADENGFQVQGDHLPQAPEIPEAIAKSLAYQASLPAQPDVYAPAASASAPAVILAKKAL